MKVRSQDGSSIQPNEDPRSRLRRTKKAPFPQPNLTDAVTLAASETPQLAPQFLYSAFRLV